MNEMEKVLLTVFTPAYNRAHLLPRLYEGLCKQTTRNFEWLIIDDGSTDDTPAVVEAFLADKDLDIRYFRKENGGKHTAHNYALQKARGEWFFCIDSDDMPTDDALCKLCDAIASVQPSDYAIAAYKQDLTGELLSLPIPPPLLSQKEHEGFYSLFQKGCSGEFSIIMRTEQLCKHPFPEISGERFATEAILYDRMDLEGFTVCLLPEVLTICEYQPDGLTSNLYRSLTQNPTGYQIYHLQRMDLVHSAKERIRHAVQYQAFRRMSGNRQYLYSGKHKLFAKLAYIPGIFGAMYYRRKQR